MNIAVKETSVKAIVSLVSGILAWTLLPWIGSIVGIISGHMARSEIRKNPETKEGDGLAIAGLILSWASFILGILAIVVIFLFFGSLLAIFGIAAANGGH